MKGKTQKGRILALVLILLMTVNLLSPAAFAAYAVPQKSVARPLVIMMEYQDYKFSDIDTKEPDFRIRDISGKDYTPEFVQGLLFGEATYTGENGKQLKTVRKFFDEVSGGTYEFNGEVVGPYTADHEASHYGGDQIISMELVREAIQKAAGDLDLSKFDVEKRVGKDGNWTSLKFGEGDGTVDTVIVIHPGIGNEWGGGSIGETVIGVDEEGEEIYASAIHPFRMGFSWVDKDGKKEKVTDKNGIEYEVDDFVLMAQDSAADMLAHEYGHVLGLPDLYGFNWSYPPVKWWDMMGGSYTGADRPGDMFNSYGAYNRELLQKIFQDNGIDAKWTNYDKKSIADIDKAGLDLELHQAHERLDGKKDLLRLDLPEKTTVINTPPSGEYSYFSGNLDNSRNYMVTKNPLDLPDYGNIELNFKTWYVIDPYFDYATIRVSDPGSSVFETVKGNITTTTEDVDEYVKDEEERKERNPGHGITDTSGGKWIDAKFDLSKYAGKQIDLKFYFWSDGNTPEEGIYIDDILITATSPSAITSPAAITILEDGADGKEEESKFTLNGFTKSTGKIIADHYYLLEWRNIQEDKVDHGLKHPYYLWPGVSYDPGLLMWYINEKWEGQGRPNQEVGAHPGECFAGVVDADPNPIVYYKNGEYFNDTSAKRVDMNMHDAAFGLRKGSKLHHDWGGGTISADKNLFMTPEFSDNKSYINPANNQNGLNLTDYGIKVLITEEKADRSSAKVHIMNRTLQNDPVDYSGGLNVKSVAIENKNTILITAENNGTDNLGDKAYIGYVKKDTVGTNKEKTINEELTFENGVYKCSAEFISFAGKGEYQISYIILEDKAGNARAIYNSKAHSGYGKDLTMGDIKSDGAKTDDIVGNPVRIIDVKTWDKAYLDKTEFEKGNTVLVNIEVETREAKTAVVIVEAMDSNGVPCALRYVPVKLTQGKSMYSLGFSTNEFAKGIATINAYVWDSLNNKTPLSKAGLFNFELK